MTSRDVEVRMLGTTLLVDDTLRLRERFHGGIWMVYVQSDSKFAIHNIGRNLNRSLWNSMDNRAEALFQRDPEVKLKIPNNIARKHRGLIDRVILGIEFTGQ